MAIRKAATRVIAYAMSFVIAVAGFALPQQAHAAEPGLMAASLQVQSNKNAALATQSQSDMTIFGADVSQWQGSINWKKAAKSLEFAIIRCGYGDNLRYQDDTRWLENARKCRTQGIPMGVYLYSYATNTTMAKSEANHVIRCLREAGITASALELPIYLDMEDQSTEGMQPSAYASIFNTFKKRLNAGGFSNVGVYANSDWWSWRLSTIKLASQYRWVAQWGSLFAGYPSVAKKGCGVWQYTEKASVSGIPGKVDGDYARYDLPFLGNRPTTATIASEHASAKSSVHLMYNANTGDYLCTVNDAERENLLLNGWVRKGTLRQALGSSDTPVYRFYNATANTHFFTTSKARYNQLARKPQWAYENVAFYSKASGAGKPVYRFTKAGKYRYSKNATMKGWTANGVAWYSA